MFHLYKIKCLTPMHVGSGEANYNIIDNEVERDLSGNPVIHSSGMKGAIRKHFEKKLSADVINKIFGTITTGDAIGTGTYKFFDAKILSRPVRVSGKLPSVPVTDVAVLNAHIRQLEEFGLSKNALGRINDVDFRNKDYLTNASSENVFEVDGCPTGRLTDGDAVSQIKNLLGLGENDVFALCKKISDVSLPVVAHNKLNDGKSEQLWYEEYVPEGSEFTFMLMTPDENVELDLQNELIQIGANASIGYGLVKFIKLY